MSIKVKINDHNAIFINEDGNEVYPPREKGHPERGLSGMVKPESLRERDFRLPPKSKAEQKMEVMNSFDDETKQAIELLKAKGIL